MRKSFLFASVVILIILGYIFFPRNVEHGLVAGSYPGYMEIYVDGKIRKFKSSVSYPKLTVLNFKFNLIKAFYFTEVTPVGERVMIKNNNLFDLESSGNKTLSKKTSYYSVDKNDNISVSASSRLIVGKNNVKSFLDKKGDLKTFLIYSINYDTMRVGLSTTNFTSTYHNKIQLRFLEPAKIFSLREKYSSEFPKDSSINIVENNNILIVTINGKTLEFKDRLYIKGNQLKLESVERGNPTFSPVYNGTLEFLPTAKGISLINEVPLEDYLCKVVPSEMPSTGGIEALKCQAIAARTYAISDMLNNRFASLGFHVDDSTQSQVYNNIQPQSLSTEAVSLTKGLIMTYNKRPIDAKYYSTSCGTSADYSDIWFNSDWSSEDVPYLKSGSLLTDSTSLPKTESEWLKFFKSTDIKAVDSDSGYFRWTVEFTNAGLTKALNKSLKTIFEKRKEFIIINDSKNELKELPELKGLVDIKPVKRGDGGNIMELSFIFSNATVNVRGDYNIRSALRCSEDFTGEPTKIISYKNNKTISSNFILSSFFSIEKQQDKFIVYGGGYGHGVGMTQNGAIQLSKSGAKYQEILNRFYKNVNIEKIY